MWVAYLSNGNIMAYLAVRREAMLHAAQCEFDQFIHMCMGTHGANESMKYFPTSLMCPW